MTDSSAGKRSNAAGAGELACESVDWGRQCSLVLLSATSTFANRARVVGLQMVHWRHELPN